MRAGGSADNYGIQHFDPYTYKDRLRKLIDDLNTDIKAITGQTTDVLCISYQVASHTTYCRYPRIALQQQELAKRLGTGPATVNDWIKGRTTPRTPTLKKLADIFGCEMVDLLKENAVFPQAEQLRSREEELKAAFFGGYADDLTKDEIDELWSDARDYLTYKIAQRRKRKE